MYPEVKFCLVKSGGLTCAMKIYMRNRTCAAPSCLWTLEFYADLLQWRCKSETSPGFAQICYSFPDDALVWLVPFQIFFLFPPPETWWTSANSVHTGSHSRNSCRGYQGRGTSRRPATLPLPPPRTPPSQHYSAPAMLYKGVWGLALMLQVLLVLASGAYLKLNPLFLLSWLPV